MSYSKLVQFKFTSTIRKKKIKRLVLSPQLRAVVYLLFGLLAEKVAGVKWQIADPGHGNILLLSCGNIGLSSCGNIGPNFPTVVRNVVPKVILSRKLVECITTVILWATGTSRLAGVQANIGPKTTSKI